MSTRFFDSHRTGGAVRVALGVGLGFGFGLLLNELMRSNTAHADEIPIVLEQSPQTDLDGDGLPDVTPAPNSRTETERKVEPDRRPEPVVRPQPRPERTRVSQALEVQKPALPTNEIDLDKAAVEPPQSEFLRIKRDRNGTAVAMQTAITRYTGQYRGRTVHVDLIGAVHIGDGNYYARLNDEFENYDAMLYELVAPPERQIPTPQLRDNKGLLTTIRKCAQILFEFEMQLDGVDYRPQNFVHADLSPVQLGEKIRERGENMMTLFFSVMADSLKQQSKLADNGQLKMPEIDLLAVVQEPGGAIKAKRALAELLTQNLEMTSAEGSTLSRILIEDRNDAAMKVLAREIKEGHNKLALFYGAAHMPDFEKQLRGLGFVKSDERWLTAWDLAPRRVTQAEHFGKMFTILNLIRQEIQ